MIFREFYDDNDWYRIENFMDYRRKNIDMGFIKRYFTIDDKHRRTLRGINIENYTWWLNRNFDRYLDEINLT